MIRIVIVIICLIALSFVINSFSDLASVITDRLCSLGVAGFALWIPLSILGVVLLGIVLYRYFVPLTDKIFDRINRRGTSTEVQPPSAGDSSTRATRMSEPPEK